MLQYKTNFERKKSLTIQCFVFLYMFRTHTHNLARILVHFTIIFFFSISYIICERAILLLLCLYILYTRSKCCSSNISCVVYCVCTIWLCDAYFLNVYVCISRLRICFRTSIIFRSPSLYIENGRVKERVREVIQKNKYYVDERIGDGEYEKKAVYDIIINHFTPFII